MCTREELNSLISELLRHIDEVAVLSAKIQYEEESKLIKPIEYLTCCDQTNNDIKNRMVNTRLNQLIRFHVAYLRYFVFSMDPYAEIIVPLSPSSLSLFITNIVSEIVPQPIVHHTSRTIMEFLQVCCLQKKSLFHFFPCF